MNGLEQTFLPLTGGEIKSRIDIYMIYQWRINDKTNPNTKRTADKRGR